MGDEFTIWNSYSDYLDREYDRYLEDQWELQYQAHLEDQYNDWLADQEAVYMSRLWREHG